MAWSPRPLSLFKHVLAGGNNKKSTTAFLQKPTLEFVGFHGSKIRPLKPISFFHSPSSKLTLSTGFVSKNAVPKSMAELFKTCVSKNAVPNTGDDDTRAHDQEVLINGSSGFTAHGLESVLNGLSKWLAAGLWAAIILWRRDAASLWAASGSFINSVLSVTLKRVLNQERPVSTLKSDPGMPSSHAQSIFFNVFFAIISILELQGVNEITLSVSGLALAIGSYLSWLRVAQQFHTLSQVVVGATLGSILSISWFWSWNAFFLKLFISSFWFRIIVSLNAGFSLVFSLYAISNWFTDER